MLKILGTCNKYLSRGHFLTYLVNTWLGKSGQSIKRVNKFESVIERVTVTGIENQEQYRINLYFSEVRATRGKIKRDDTYIPHYLFKTNLTNLVRIDSIARNSLSVSIRGNVCPE